MTTTNSRRTRLLTAGALVAALALTAAGIGAAYAGTEPPPLAFVAATPNVTALRVDDGEFQYLDFNLGVNLIAGKNPFEIRAKRKSYADPIVAQQAVFKKGKKTLVTLPNAAWRPGNTDLSTSCGGNTAVAVREVLDVGNGDTYSQARPGQSFEITGLPNGTYYIEVKANPSNKLSELSTRNNSALRKIILGGTATNRTLKVPPVNGIKG